MVRELCFPQTICGKKMLWFVGCLSHHNIQMLLSAEADCLWYPSLDPSCRLHTMVVFASWVMYLFMLLLMILWLPMLGVFWGVGWGCGYCLVRVIDSYRLANINSICLAISFSLPEPSRQGKSIGAVPLWWRCILYNCKFKFHFALIYRIVVVFFCLRDVLCHSPHS